MAPSIRLQVDGAMKQLSLEGHRSDVRALPFSPDGDHLASGGEDGGVIVWDLGTSPPRPLRTAGHREWVFSLAFSPDGELLASGGGDQTTRPWDVASGVPVGGPLAGHASSVFGLTFSRDGKRLASSTCADWDTHFRCLVGQIYVWDVDGESWRVRACQIANRNLSREEWQQHMVTAPYSCICEGLAAGEGAPAQAPGCSPAATPRAP